MAEAREMLKLSGRYTDRQMTRQTRGQQGNSP